MEDYKHDGKPVYKFCRVIIGKILIVEESIKLFTTLSYLPKEIEETFHFIFSIEDTLVS